MAPSPTIRAFLEANKLLLGTNCSRELTVNVVITFLGVALWEHEVDSSGEPLPLTELARRLDFSPSTISQHLRYLGDKYRSERTGSGLVRTEDHPNDRRHKVFFLTPKGQAIARSLEYILTASRNKEGM